MEAAYAPRNFKAAFYESTALSWSPPKNRPSYSLLATSPALAGPDVSHLAEANASATSGGKKKKKNGNNSKLQK